MEIPVKLFRLRWVSIGLALFMLLATIVLPAAALDAHSGRSIRLVTVAELEQLLAQGRGQSDRDIAKQLSSVELTQRLSDRRWRKWDPKLPGRRSHQALEVLADTSAFLQLPSADILDAPAPDLNAQRVIMKQTVDYVLGLSHLLPNLFATMQTIAFKNLPREVVARRGAGMIGMWQPMKFISSSEALVTYRDGAEILGPASDKLLPSERHPLVTSGEFGPILAMVLFDAAHGQMTWSHWEKGLSGIQAVFDYSVPLAQSHYQPGYCCTMGRISMVKVGYSGEIAVDPSSGRVLRLTMLTATPPDIPMIWSGTMVQYGPVDLGNKIYFCPLRTVSISQAMPETEAYSLGNVMVNGGSLSQGPLRTLLNDTVFENYHLFRATVRILPAH